MQFLEYYTFWKIKDFQKYEKKKEALFENNTQSHFFKVSK